jgi:FkbM family methyltransferase
MIRATLEKISRNVVFKRHLPPENGDCSVFVTPEAGLRYWRPDFSMVDKPLLDICAEIVRPGCVVWDIGANVGLFSFSAAGLAGPTGKVYAIEPDTFLVALLRKSAHANPDAAPVEVLPIALAERVGFERFIIAERSRAASHLRGHGSSQAGGMRESQTVVVVTLDWLALQVSPPNIVKIDSEGAEARILSAGGQMLSRHRPIVICEVMAENSAAVTSILRTAKYAIFDGTQPKACRKRLDEAPWDTLAIPE